MKIKGHTTIELFDAKTGKLVQRTEDDNMLTKALYYFYDEGGWTNPSALNADALRSDALHYMLGGLMCLDTALTESDEIVRVPAGVGMTANGAYNVLNGGNPPELGSWSELESGWQPDNSYKMVWNYNTAQGNGTVACVCLSSLYGGMQGIGNKSVTNKANAVNPNVYNSIINKSIGQNETVIGTYNNFIFTVANGINDWKGLTKKDVKVYKFPLNQLDIRCVSSAELVETVEAGLPAAMQNLTGGLITATALFQEGVNTYILIMELYNTDNTAWRPLGRVLIWNNQTRTFSAAYEVNPAGLPENINICGITPARAVLGKYSIDFTNLADVEELSDAAQIEETIYHPSARHIFTATQDATLYSNTGYYADLTAKTILPVNGAYTLGSFVKNKLMGLSGAGIYRDPRYIATINNLDAPITKDASKTMKVTYVLRFPN